MEVVGSLALETHSKTSSLGSHSKFWRTRREDLRGLRHVKVVAVGLLPVWIRLTGSVIYIVDPSRGC